MSNSNTKDYCLAGYVKCLLKPGTDYCERCGRILSGLNLVDSAEWKSYSAEEDFERSRIETGVSNDIFSEEDMPARGIFGKRAKKSPAQRRKEAFDAAVSSVDLSKVEDVSKALKGCAVPFEKDVHAHLTQVCKKCGLQPSLSNKVWIFFHNFVGAWCCSSAPLVQARIAAECNYNEDSSNENDEAVCRRGSFGTVSRKQVIGKRIIVEFIKRNFPCGDKYICGCIYLVCRRELQIRAVGHLSFKAISLKTGCASVKEIYAAIKAINKVVPPSNVTVPGSGVRTLACPNYDGIIEAFSSEMGLGFPAKRMSKNVGRMLKELMAGSFTPETVGATAIYLVCTRVFQEKYSFDLKDYVLATGLSEKTLKRAFSQADTDPQMFSLPYKEAKLSGL